MTNKKEINEIKYLKNEDNWMMNSITNIIGIKIKYYNRFHGSMTPIMIPKEQQK